MTLDQFRPQINELLKPLRPYIVRCGKLGITPNLFSVAALIAAFAAGAAFYYKQLIVGVGLVALNALFDSLDGIFARACQMEGKRGDFLDHVFDRYADIFIITGLFAGGAASWEIGIFALTGVLMSSYLGTQAQAVGVGRYYGGILGRADRLLLVMIAGILDILIPGGVFDLAYLGWLLIFFGLLGHVTAIQRFVYVLQRL